MRSSVSTATSSRTAPSARRPSPVPDSAQGHPRRHARAPRRHRRRRPPGRHLQRPARRPQPGDHLRHQPPGRRRAWPTAAKAAGVDRFVFSSSCSLYGAHGDDAHRRERRRSTRSRPTASRRCCAERDLHGPGRRRLQPDLPAQRHRLRRVAPPARRPGGQQPRRATPSRTGKVLLKSDGTPWRPLVHIEDISRAFLAAAGGAAGRRSTTRPSTSAAPRRTTASARWPRSSPRSCRDPVDLRRRARAPTSATTGSNCDKLAERLPGLPAQVDRAPTASEELYAGLSSGTV